MFIPRVLTKNILEKLQTTRKGIILYGPRQVGKTTLVQKLIKDLPFKTLSINAEEYKYKDVLSSKDLAKLRSLVLGYELIFIDEAQKISDIGINLKLLIDNLPSVKILATGSSSLDLASKISEPLTGRIWSYTLYPISFLELKFLYNEFELKAQLDERLVFGSYPEIFSFENNQTKREYLDQLVNSYLYKDVFELATIKRSSKIHDLVKLLAFQIGSQVSISELATSLAMSRTTIEHYIDLLEKSFVLFRIGGFSRNLRKEITKMDKIYFYDLGVRNIVIDNLKDLKDRNDVGQLWENFLMVERIKYLHYKRKFASQYFWRIYTGAELDYVEESEGEIYGYEFKYGNKIARAPATWLSTYTNAHFTTINQENFLNFIT